MTGSIEGVAESALLGQGPQIGNTQFLVIYALDLVGHNLVETNPNWVISCYKGQAVYPMILDTLSLKKRGYLSFGWMRGTLQHDGETYNEVLATRRNENGDLFSKPILEKEKLEIQAGVTPSNFYTDLKPTWWVSGSEKCLSANLFLSGARNKFSYCYRNPMNVLLNLGSCLFVDSCPHQPYSPLSAADSRCSYTGLVDVNQHLKPGEEPKEGQIGIVAVDGNESLRFFALSANGLRLGCVIREQACLACCITICRKAKHSILIL